MNDNREAGLKAEVERLRHVLDVRGDGSEFDLPQFIKNHRSWTERAEARATSAESALTEARAEIKHYRQHSDDWYEAFKQANASSWEYYDRAESAEAALVSEREAHAGLRARLEALADEVDGWTPYDSRDTGETFLAESVREFVADLRAALAAVAPVAAEEGGEQEAGEGWERHVSTRCPRMAEHGRIEVVDGKAVDKSPFPCPDCYSIESFWHCVPWEPPLRTPVSRSGSDEQGNRPATPDANGVHDTKGGEAVHLVARDASDAPLARTFCGVATNGTGVRHTASLSIVNCAACLAGLCHADVEDDER